MVVSVIVRKHRQYQIVVMIKQTKRGIQILKYYISKTTTEGWGLFKITKKCYIIFEQP